MTGGTICKFLHMQACVCVCVWTLLVELFFFFFHSLPKLIKSFDVHVIQWLLYVFFFNVTYYNLYNTQNGFFLYLPKALLVHRYTQFFVLYSASQQNSEQTNENVRQRTCITISLISLWPYCCCCYCCYFRRYHCRCFGYRCVFIFNITLIVWAAMLISTFISKTLLWPRVFSFMTSKWAKFAVLTVVVWRICQTDRRLPPLHTHIIPGQTILIVIHRQQSAFHQTH